MSAVRRTFQALQASDRIYRAWLRTYPTSLRRRMATRCDRCSPTCAGKPIGAPGGADWPRSGAAKCPV
jgi:hypothetical protein